MLLVMFIKQGMLSLLLQFFGSIGGQLFMNS